MKPQPESRRETWVGGAGAETDPAAGLAEPVV